MYGVAYHIPPDKEEEVSDHLDYREKGGYVKHSVLFNPSEADAQPFELDIYIGTSDNPYFLGPANIKELANQIYHAVGPSGPNTEYLFQLAEAMRTVAPQVRDNHLEELEHEVSKLCDGDKTQ